MIQPCNQKHLSEIAYYCQELKLGVCSNCYPSFKVKGNNLSLISEIVKLQLGDLKNATSQALKLNKAIFDLCNKSQNIGKDQTKNITKAFDNYISAVLKAKEKILSEINSKIQSKGINNNKKLKEIMGNLDKTIIDADNYNYSITNLLSQNQLFKILTKMQEISVKQWADEMINIKKFIANFTPVENKAEEYNISIPDLTYKSILMHVGINQNQAPQVLSPKYSPIRNYSDPLNHIPQKQIKSSNINNLLIVGEKLEEANISKSPEFNKLIAKDNNNEKENESEIKIETTKYKQVEKEENKLKTIPISISDSPMNRLKKYAENARNSFQASPKSNDINKDLYYTFDSQSIEKPNPLKLIKKSEYKPPNIDDPTITFHSNVSNLNKDSSDINTNEIQKLLFNFELDRITIIDVSNKSHFVANNFFAEEFPTHGFPFIYIKEGIFLNGGLKNGKVLFHAFSFSIKNNKLEKQMNLIKNRSFHSLVKSNYSIYSIGGIDESGFTMSSCEKVTVNEFNPTIFSNLNYPRSSAIALSITEQFLYCFCGWNESAKDYITSIEQFDFRRVERFWKNITIQKDQNYMITRYASNIAEISSGLFIIFGGRNQNTVLDNCLIFSPESNFSLHSSKLSLPTNFYKHCGQPLQYNNVIYSICDLNIVHCLNLSNMQWTIDSGFTFNKFL